jgi:enoyl-[acyl-carrier-protein] reductase (NADH)
MLTNVVPTPSGHAVGRIAGNQRTARRQRHTLTGPGAEGRGLARELSSRGITVNTVQPGPTDTDMNPDQGDFADTMKAMLPVGHYAHPDDIASAVAYLARPEARFITGTTWDVDGGYAV